MRLAPSSSTAHSAGWTEPILRDHARRPDVRPEYPAPPVPLASACVPRQQAWFGAGWKVVLVRGPFAGFGAASGHVVTSGCVGRRVAGLTPEAAATFRRRRSVHRYYLLGGEDRGAGRRQVMLVRTRDLPCRHTRRRRLGVFWLCTASDPGRRRARFRSNREGGQRSSGDDRRGVGTARPSSFRSRRSPRLVWLNDQPRPKGYLGGSESYRDTLVHLCPYQKTRYVTGKQTPTVRTVGEDRKTLKWHGIGSYETFSASRQPHPSLSSCDASRTLSACAADQNRKGPSRPSDRSCLRTPPITVHKMLIVTQG